MEDRKRRRRLSRLAPDRINYGIRSHTLFLGTRDESTRLSGITLVTRFV